jgi:hypothetical protein
MKKNIIVLIFFILSIALSAQIPKALTVRIGDSELKGLAGVELQVSRFSISGGWRPGHLPYGGSMINSFDLALTIYSKQWYESSWYLSIGRASRGIVYATKLNIYSGLNEYKAEPSIIGILGYRTNFFPDFNNRLYIDTGFGYNIGKNSNLFAFEVVINYALFKK